MAHTAAPTQRADLLGIACSAGCALHCAAMPVLATAAPALGMGWFSGSLVHQVIAVVCCVLVVRAILPVWRQHRDRLVAFCVGFGLTLLVLAAFVLPDPCCQPTSIFGWFGLPLLGVEHLQLGLGNSITEGLLIAQPYMTPIGGVLLIAAHVMNLDLGRRQNGGHCAVGGCLGSSGC
jgi:hypothetical protein